MSDPVHPEHHELPDRFTRWGQGFATVLELHWQRIVVAVALVLVVGMGWVGYARHRADAAAEAQARVAAIEAVFPGDGSEVPEETIRSALERYETFLKEAPEGSVAFWIGRLHLAEAHEALGELDAARAAYEALLKAPPVFAGPARMRLAYLAASRGEMAEAGTGFAKVVEQVPGLAPQAALEQGRLAELAAADEAAIAAYRLVTARFPNTPQASEADARLRALGVEPEPVPMPEPSAVGEPAAPTPPEADGDARKAPENAPPAPPSFGPAGDTGTP